MELRSVLQLVGGFGMTTGGIGLAIGGSTLARASASHIFPERELRKFKSSEVGKLVLAVAAAQVGVGVALKGVEWLKFCKLTSRLPWLI